jgi:class 3 adenylate cyclase
VVLKEVGLGIGLDYGETHLVHLKDGLTVVGNPVVYACRLSGAPAGVTLLNQPAFEKLFSDFSAYCTFGESDYEVNNEGRIVAYTVQRNGKDCAFDAPTWETYRERATGDESPNDSKPTPHSSGEGV